MAKKSAISGEYIITQEDNYSIKAHRIYDNVIGSLREIAESKEMEYDTNWTTRQLGTKLIKELGDGNMAVVGEYTIIRLDSGSIETYRHYSNTIGALREIAASVNFEYDPKWNTQTFGSKLIDYVNSNK